MPYTGDTVLNDTSLPYYHWATVVLLTGYKVPLSPIHALYQHYHYVYGCQSENTLLIQCFLMRIMIYEMKK